MTGRSRKRVLSLALAAACWGSGCAQAPDYRITPLHCGSCTLGKRHLWGNAFTDEERVPFVLYAFLCEGPKGEIVLVDLGPKTLHFINNVFRRVGLLRKTDGRTENPDDIVQPHGNVLDNLNRRGIRLEDVGTIILTHLHYDHVGMAEPPDPGAPKDFPGAVFFVSRKGWEDNLARRIDGWRWASYVDADLSSFLLRREAQGKAHFADDARVMPGIRTRYLGGHSVCSQAVLVNTRAGVAIITSDECYRYDLLEAGIIARLRVEEDAMIRAIDALVSLAEETGGILVPVHDPAVWTAYEESGDGWLERLRPVSDRAVAGYRATRDSLTVLPLE